MRGLCSISLVFLSCSGPPQASPIEGVPVCSDYKLGSITMRGGLKYPVHLEVKSGSDIAAFTSIYGKRTESDPPVRVLLPDADAEYTVVWSQCSNERATRSVENAPQSKDAPLDYSCGEAKTYKTESLKTAKGNLTSHTLRFVPAPQMDCWK